MPTLTNIIIGNLISLTGCIIDFVVGMKYNEKKIIIRFNYLSCSLSIIALIFLGAYEGMIEACITLLRLIVINYKDQKGKKWYGGLVLFMFSYALVFTQGFNIKTMLTFSRSMVSFIPKWVSRNMQVIRVCALISYIMVMIYNFMIKNYAPLAFQFFSTAGLVLTIMRWYGLAPNKKLNAERDEIHES